jgi:hypothetical protein
MKLRGLHIELEKLMAIGTPKAVADDALGSTPHAGSSHRSVHYPKFVRMPAPATQLLRLDQGLFALRVHELAGSPSNISSFSLPAVQIAALPQTTGKPVEIVGLSRSGGLWLGNKVPAGGGELLITTFDVSHLKSSAPTIDIWRLDRR